MADNIAKFYSKSVFKNRVPKLFKMLWIVKSPRKNAVDENVYNNNNYNKTYLYALNNEKCNGGCFTSIRPESKVIYVTENLDGCVRSKLSWLDLQALNPVTPIGSK